MKTFFRIAYLVVGIVQFFAGWDGVEYVIGAESFIARMFSFFVSLFLTYIPLLGSAVGVYGAVNAWDWSFTKALVLFFWYVPLFLLLIGYGFIADRR